MDEKARAPAWKGHEEIDAHGTQGATKGKLVFFKKGRQKMVRIEIFVFVFTLYRFQKFPSLSSCWCQVLQVVLRWCQVGTLEGMLF